MLSSPHWMTPYLWQMFIQKSIAPCVSAIIFASVVLILSCGESRDFSLTEVHEAGMAVKTTARIDVTGMMCAHACGGKIKKELLAVKGVANAVIDFELERDLNHAEVEFDPAQVQVAQLVAAVTEIAEGKLYGVDAVQLTHFAKSANLP
jgi:copper chaperone CopZ